MMISLVGQATALHILFMGSIFVMYFRSPVISNLTPEADLIDPPAKRLILIVTDGLRAESFFNNACENIPKIKTLLIQGGMVGISHTHVPTESRPGHIALISGFYEDPSAVTKGWKDNPVDFDSVFNRSKLTYAWGSHDVVSMFARNRERHIRTITYKDDLDFSGKNETSLLDIWVFSQVKEFLQQNIFNLRKEERLVLFLHLLGLDTAGHVHKPGSRPFLENLGVVDNGVYEIYTAIENMFRDERSAYILTSDHGMTDSGSHGAGGDFETQTPFFMWGAGLNNWNFLNSYSNVKRFLYVDGRKVPLFDIEQADVTPLMSSLIGVAVPVNNIGKLPKSFLNVSQSYLAKAMKNNAMQIFAQYTVLLNEFNRGIFSKYLPCFRRISPPTYSHGLKNKVEVYEHLLNESLDGIAFFQNYYEKPLLVTTSLSFFGWIIYLLTVLLSFSRIKWKRRNLSISLMASIFLTLSIVYAQNIPLLVAVYLVLPVLVWSQLVALEAIKFVLKICMKNFGHLIIVFVSIELLVFSFIDRRLVSLIMFFYGLSEFRVAKRHNYETSKSVLLSWVISVIVLCIFPFFPAASNLRNNTFLFLGLIAELANAYFNWECNSKKYFYVLFLTATLNIGWAVYHFDNFLGISSINVMGAWFVSGLSFLLPLVTTQSMSTRFEAIMHYLFIPYMHLSIGYEIIFMAVFILAVNSWVKLQELKTSQQEILEMFNVEKVSTHFHLSISMILLTLFSIFGTGNMASISSFDPTVVRLYVTTFSPFLMSFLIILKLAIPVIFVMCAIIRSVIIQKMDTKKIFVGNLIVCQIMAANFLFMVTNKGSWLDIGTSISRFVIMESITLLLTVIYLFSKCLLYPAEYMPPYSSTKWK